MATVQSETYLSCEVNDGDGTVGEAYENIPLARLHSERTEPLRIHLHRHRPILIVGVPVT